MTNNSAIRDRHRLSLLPFRRACIEYFIDLLGGGGGDNVLLHLIHFVRFSGSFHYAANSFFLFILHGILAFDIIAAYVIPIQIAIDGQIENNCHFISSIY